MKLNWPLMKDPGGCAVQERRNAPAPVQQHAHHAQRQRQSGNLKIKTNYFNESYDNKS
mgnify:CR=1 FL=1